MNLRVNRREQPSGERTSRMSPEVIVIGAGPGGLSIAMILAAAGVRVRVFERNTQVGGRTTSIESQGYRFDLGPGAISTMKWS